MAPLSPRSKTPFISTSGGIGVLCGLAGIFVLFIVAGCIYNCRRKTWTERRAQREWVRERRAEVKQQREEAAETRRRTDVAMRMNEVQHQSQEKRSADRTRLSGPRKPESARIHDFLPPYENRDQVLLTPPPAASGVGRAGSQSSVPSYTSASAVNANGVKS